MSEDPITPTQRQPFIGGRVNVYSMEYGGAYPRVRPGIIVTPRGGKPHPIAHVHMIGDTVTDNGNRALSNVPIFDSLDANPEARDVIADTFKVWCEWQPATDVDELANALTALGAEIHAMHERISAVEGQIGETNPAAPPPETDTITTTLSDEDL